MNIFNLHSLAILEFTSCAFLLSHTFGNSRYSRRFVHKLNTRSKCIQLQYGGIHPKLRSLNRTLSVSSGIRCSEISPSRPAKSSECCVIIEGCKNWQFCSQSCTASPVVSSLYFLVRSPVVALSFVYLSRRYIYTCQTISSQRVESSLHSNVEGCGTGLLQRNLGFYMSTRYPFRKRKLIAYCYVYLLVLIHVYMYHLQGWKKLNFNMTF